jgi:hypothetical protein
MNSPATPLLFALNDRALTPQGKMGHVCLILAASPEHSYSVSVPGERPTIYRESELTVVDASRAEGMLPLAIITEDFGDAEPSLAEMLEGSLSIIDELPPHDGDRTEATDGFDDEGMTNGDRADSVQHCLGNGDEDGRDNAERISDLICNLLHFAHSLETEDEGVDVRRVLRSALDNFAAEAGAL